ncbi:MAG: hypothetical protein OEZ58_17475, partial [Gammaproteobacteria bacterium]|nr:hypothetical protein [Gammaproteobacteria bacterium]
MVYCDQYISKLSKPRLVKYYPRKTLFSCLDTCLEKDIVWVVGIAGAGKSSLISSYSKERDLSTCWYQLEKQDETLSSFFSVLNCSALSLDKDFLDRVPHFDETYMSDIELYVRHYFRHFFSLFKKNQILVFDDAHLIATDSQLHLVFKTAMSVLPPDNHLIFISREMPPFLYDDLRAKHFSILEGNELKLNATESKNIIRLLCSDKPISEDQADALQAMSGGWVTGLILLLENPASLDATNSNIFHNQALIFSVLANDVFNQFSDDAKDLLMSLSLLPWFDLAMVELLGSNKFSKNFILQLERSVFFIARLEGSGNKFRMHDLFKDFLLDCLFKTQTNIAINQQIDKLSSLLEQQHHIDESIAVALKSPDKSHFIFLIDKYAPHYYETGRIKIVAKWIGQLDQTEIAEHNWLQFWVCLADILEQPAEVRLSLEHLYRRFESDSDIAGQVSCWCVIIDTYIYEFSSFASIDPWIEVGESFIENLLSQLPQTLRDRVTCAMFIALMYRQPGHQQMQYWLDAATHLYYHTQNFDLKAYLGPHLIVYRTWWDGNLLEAQTLLAGLEPLNTEKTCQPFIRIMILTYSSALKWELAQYESCLEESNQGLQLADEYGIHVFDGLLLWQGSVAALCTGDLELGQQKVDQMDKLLFKQNRPGADHHFYNAIYFCSRAWICRLRKETDSELRYAKQAVNHTEVFAAPFYHSVTQIEYGRLMAMRDNEKSGLALIEQGIASGKNFLHNGSTLFLGYKALAEIFKNNGQHEKCVHYLEKMLHIGQQCGFVSHIFWSDEEMVELFNFALHQAIHVDYVQRVIKTRNLQPPLENASHLWPNLIHIDSFGEFVVTRDNQSVFNQQDEDSLEFKLLKSIVTLGGENILRENLSRDIGIVEDELSPYLTRLNEKLGTDNALIFCEDKISLNRRYICLDSWALMDSTPNHDDEQQSLNTNLAKISIPRKCNLLRRDRLFQQIDHAREKPVLWIT